MPADALHRGRRTKADLTLGLVAVVLGCVFSVWPACGADAALASDELALRVEPDDGDLGDVEVAVGAFRDATVTASNRGSTALTITGVHLASDPSPYEILSDDCTDERLEVPPGRSECLVRVRFHARRPVGPATTRVDFVTSS